MNKQKLIWISLILGLFILAGCAQAAPVEEAGLVETAVPDEAENGDAEPTATPLPRGVTVLADGNVKVERPSLALGFNASGKLLELLVEPGDRVAEGDLIAILDDTTLTDSIANAQLQVSQAESNLAQAEADLDKLVNWEPDALAVELAEANLASAEASLANAQTSDAVAGSNATSARVSLDQAERALVDAEEAVATAYDPGREWEFGVEWMRKPLEDERKAADRNLVFAQEQVEVARANYSVAWGSVNSNSAVSAEASVVNAQQALEQALQGPKQEEIDAAQRTVERAEITLQQNQLSLEQAERALEDAKLYAPWDGTVLTIDAAPGAFVGSGTPIITLLDTAQLAFHTTNLSERDLAQIEPGQPAQITLKAYPDDVIAGTVLRIGVQAEGTVGDAATFPVIIAIEASDFDIRPGMTGRVEIINEAE